MTQPRPGTTRNPIMINRRDLLRQSAAAAPLWFLPAGARSSGATPRRSGRLVVLFLRGAADALNIVVPFGESAYYSARPRIAVAPPGQQDGALDLDGHFGLHPALAELMPLWRDRSLAFIHASGSPDPSRSHFDAQSFMETGTPGVKSTNDGWMNRLLQIMVASEPGLQAAAFQPTVPLILSGALPVRTMSRGLGNNHPKVFTDPSINAALSRLYVHDSALAEAYRQAGALSGRVGDGTLPDSGQPDSQEAIAANNGAPPPGGLPHTAALVAKRMREDETIRLAFVSVGGWDTHSGEGGGKGNLANNLRKLGEALGLLAQDLGPLYRQTVIVVISEFGRALREDGGGGTDHGHGSVMWLLGGPVAGGKVYGAWPGLGDGALHDGRDLAVTTDFRCALAAVIGDHLEITASKLSVVFPGMPAIAPGLGHLIV